MNLYLSSFRLGNRGAELARLIQGRVAFVGNALDGHDADVRDRVIKRGIDDLREVGVESETVDLRAFFNGNESLPSVLAGYGAVFVSGGNVFILRRAMRLSGFDDFIAGQAVNSSFLYAGYSAGACVAGPTLRGLDKVDDAADAPDGYPSDVIWDGLSLTPYSIVPHWRSDHPESSAIDSVVDDLLERKFLFKVLRDGEVLIENGAPNPRLRLTGDSRDC